jgi:8-oxo-dGTP pyrophosphatase MutT (NUDIX family)
MTEHKSAGFIVYKDNPREFLLLHYVKNHWDFPKGHIEKGENEIKAALRELKEETGIDKIDIMPFFRETSEYYFRDETRLNHKTVVFYIGKTHDSNVTISDEHIAYAWLPFDKALAQITYKNSKDLLKKANNFLKKYKL